MQNDKKQSKHTISWLMVSVLTKTKVMENVGVDPEAGPSLDSEWSDI